MFEHQTSTARLVNPSTALQSSLGYHSKPRHPSINSGLSPRPCFSMMEAAVQQEEHQETLTAASTEPTSPGASSPGSPGKGAFGLVLTLNRVKSFIKEDPDVKSISTEACFAVARATVSLAVGRHCWSPGCLAFTNGGSVQMLLRCLCENAYESRPVYAAQLLPHYVTDL